MLLNPFVVPSSLYFRLDNFSHQNFWLFRSHFSSVQCRKVCVDDPIIKESVEKSLSCLSKDYTDFLHIHWVVFISKIIFAQNNFHILFQIDSYTIIFHILHFLTERENCKSEFSFPSSVSPFVVLYRLFSAHILHVNSFIFHIEFFILCINMSSLLFYLTKKTTLAPKFALCLQAR